MYLCVSPSVYCIVYHFQASSSGAGKLSQCERDKNSCLTGLLRLAPNYDSTIKKPNFTSYPPLHDNSTCFFFFFNLSTILKLCIFVATLTYSWIPGQAAVADGCLQSFTSELLNCSSRPRMSNSFYIMGHIQPSLILHGENRLSVTVK